MPKYNYEFYCGNNKDDFTIMTIHEDDLRENNFTPKEGDIFFDIGAYHGPYTVIATKHVGTKGRMTSIKEDPDNFNLLNCNIILNNSQIS